MEKQKIKCSFCKAFTVVKKGFRQTEHKGKIQRFYCKSCKKSFVVDDGFYRMRNDPKKITKAVDLYFSSLSSRKVKNNFKRHEETIISHNSILTWCRKYSKLISDYVNSLEPRNLSWNFYADDTEVKVLGNTTHLWVNIDYGTKYLTGIHFSLKSGYKEATEFIKKSVRFGLPNFIQTDGAVFYPRVFKKLFGLSGKNRTKVLHKIQNAHKTGIHNVQIETVFSKIKDRVKQFRGLKSYSSAPLLLFGIVLQHNFIEEHSTTHKVPSELAGINLETGLNRWLGLIKMAVRNL